MDKNYESMLIVGAGLIGAFISRYVDISMRYAFPIDLISILLGIILAFFVTRFILLR